MGRRVRSHQVQDLTEGSGGWCKSNGKVCCCGPGGPCRLNNAFLGKLYETKVAECPHFCVGRSCQIRSRKSAAVVPALIKLKLGRCFTLMGHGRIDQFHPNPWAGMFWRAL